MFNETSDKYHNVYLIYHLEEIIPKDIVIFTAHLRISQKNKRELLDVFVTYNNKLYDTKGLDYKLPENRKGFTKKSLDELEEDDSDLYRYPIIYIVYNTNIVQSGKDFVMAKWEQKIVDLGEIG